MFPHEELEASVSKETVANLRHRLSVMKEILGDEDDPKVSQVRKRNSRRKGCMDTILDGSFMGLVLGACFIAVLGTVFFAYKNLYFAIMKKIFPDPFE